jgi:outer membrane protein assembly factor BamB
VVDARSPNLFALKASTGAEIWSYTADGEFRGPGLTVSNGVVYTGSINHKLYALKASTGVRIWSDTTGNFVWSPPAVVKGVVYIGSADNNVYALKASTGALIWSYTSRDGVDSAPVVVDGALYFASNHKLCALNASTGAKIWSYTTGSYLSLPAVVNGVVYFVSGHKVYALNASTETKIWSYTAGSLVVANVSFGTSPWVTVVGAPAEEGRPACFEFDRRWTRNRNYETNRLVTRGTPPWLRRETAARSPHNELCRQSDLLRLRRKVPTRFDSGEE